MAEPTTVTPPAPAAGAKTSPEKPADKPLTEPQLKGVQRFATTFLTGEKPPPEKPETPEEKTARETKEKEAAEKEKAKTAKPTAKPAAKPARKPEPPKQLTGDEIAEAAARGVATAMQAKPADTKPADKPAGPELSDAEKRRVGVLEQMEKMFPDKYKGLAEKYKTGLTALANYAAQWEKDHPGQPFEEDAEEHEEFFSKNAPDWEDDDYTEALTEIKSEEKVAKVSEKTNERLTKFERAEKLREEEPKIAAATTRPASLFWKDHGEDFGGIIKEDGSVDVEKFKTLQAADPVTFGIRLQAAQTLDAEVRELYKVMNGLVDYDPNNKTHRVISTFADQKERELSEKPQDERLDAEGRDFLPAAKYYKLSKEKRKDFWTFGVDELAALRAAALADWSKNLVKSEEEKLENWAKARGLKKPDATGEAPPAKKPEDELEPETADGKPLSPSTSSESRMAATKNKDTKGVPEFTSSFLSKQFGK